MAPLNEPPPPWLADAYEHLGVLGRGGAGVVHRMRERATGRAVAVKVATGDAERAELAHEVAVAGELRHPNVLEVRAVAGPGGALAVVSPYVAGGTLRAALDAARAAADPEARVPLGYARTAALLRDVAAGLAHAHRAGVVHADVKPENVFLDACGGHALLADFGIARRVGRGTHPGPRGGSAGTPAYMAPEQVDEGPLDARTDVYALGLLGWELLAGRRPWEGLALDVVLRAQRVEALPALAELCPDVPAYLLAAVEGALSKDPTDRWADADEMLRRLTPVPARLPMVAAPDPAVAAGATLQLPPRTSATAVVGPSRRRPRRVAAAVLAGIAVAGVAFGLPTPRRVPPGEPSLRSVTTPARVVAGAEGMLPSDGDAGIAAESRPRSVPMGTSHMTSPSTASSGRVRTGAGPCGVPTASAQQACARRLAASAERRAATALASLADAMRAAAPAGWEPAAVRQLEAEHARWAADADRACPIPARGWPTAGAPSWGTERGACLVARAERRVEELRVRRARFSPGTPMSPDRPR